MGRLKKNLSIDGQEEADLQLFTKVFLLAVFGLVFFVLGLQLGLREGRLEMPKDAYGAQHDPAAKTRQEIVSRWYQ